MADLIDYVKWRGDVDFKASPFNAVDNLVLCQISYLHFDGLLDSSFKSATPLSELFEKFISTPDFEKRKEAGALISNKTYELFTLTAKSNRFKNLLARGFINKIDEEKEEQFCAITYSDKKTHYIIFRGTDDTLVGWKEDFNLGFMDTVPSQKDALTYLSTAASSLWGTFILCGHSKGGNLSIYSASMSPEKIQKRITAIYNNDGPGFKKEFFSEPGYLAIREKEKSFVPQMSIIGMLFCHSDKYVTVENDAQGFYQHDPFTWHVGPTGFVERPDTNEESKFIEKTVNQWFNELEKEQKKQFIETMFSVLRAPNASTNTQLAENWGETIMQMLKAMTKIDAKTRDAVGKTLQLLFKNAWENRESLKKK